MKYKSHRLSSPTSNLKLLSYSSAQHITNTLTLNSRYPSIVIMLSTRVLTLLLAAAFAVANPVANSVAAPSLPEGVTAAMLPSSYTPDMPIVMLPKGTLIGRSMLAKRYCGCSEYVDVGDPKWGSRCCTQCSNGCGGYCTITCGFSYVCNSRWLTRSVIVQN
jgi:hypothetical protein